MTFITGFLIGSILSGIIAEIGFRSIMRGLTKELDQAFEDFYRDLALFKDGLPEVDELRREGM